MNTFAKVGRIALSHLFTKKEKIFETTRYEEIGLTKVFPRTISTSNCLVDLDEKYLGHMVGTMGREKNYKIFFWSVEMGLTEILLVSDENEGKLSDLICRFAKGPVTHIVIAEKYEWNDTLGMAWHLSEDIDESNHCVVEHVMIYSLTEEQKQYLANRIQNEEFDQLENEEDFTFDHGYFPENGIVYFPK